MPSFFSVNPLIADPRLTLVRYWNFTHYPTFNRRTIMATRKVGKKPVSTAAKRTVRRAAKPAVATASVAHKVVQAGLGAAERVQGNAVKVYGAIARETGRLSEMTTEAAKALTRKANLFVKEGQKIQSNVQAAAETKAREVAKEVKAFAAKSEKSFKKKPCGLTPKF